MNPDLPFDKLRANGKSLFTIMSIKEIRKRVEEKILPTPTPPRWGLSLLSQQGFLNPLLGGVGVGKKLN